MSFSWARLFVDSHVTEFAIHKEISWKCTLEGQRCICAEACVGTKMEVLAALGKWWRDETFKRDLSVRIIYGRVERYKCFLFRHGLCITVKVDGSFYGYLECIWTKYTPSNKKKITHRQREILLASCVLTDCISTKKLLVLNTKN